jgi:hypothetical protein
MILKKICFSILFIIVWIIPRLSIAEEMVVKKIILAHFKVKDGHVVNLPKSDPYWPQVDRHILTVDDHGRIYILNLWNNEILIFNDSEKFNKKISLPGKPYRSVTKKPLAGEGYLEVSGDGKQFIVDIPLFKGFILDQNGKVIKQFSKEETLQSFPDILLCNDTYIFLQKNYVYDKDFRLISRHFPGFADSEGKYDDDVWNNTLIKYAKNGKKLWNKKFYRIFGIIGIDSNNFLYIKGELRKGEPYSLYKLNSKGEIMAQAPIPDPFPFITREEKNEWETRSSEEFLSFFKVACNGDVFLIYQLYELPNLTFKRWLNGGEYFIYKFETKK